MEKAKRLDIEIMRILAAFFVIFNHTGKQGFFLFSCYDSHSPQFWVYLFLSVFCKFSVPLFFMISGVLLLNRETTSYREFLKKKVGRILLILVVWSVVYYLVKVYRGWEELSLKTFLKTLYVSQWEAALWYLYAYIAFLLTVPILQKIAKALSDKEFLYLFALVFLFCSLRPAAEYLLWDTRYSLNPEFSLYWLKGRGFLCPLLGYFLAHRAADYWNKTRLTILWLINIAAILLSCYLTYLHAQLTGELSEGASQHFHNVFVEINCAAIFATCQYIAKNVKIPGSVQKMIFSVSGTTFGVYLMHILVMNMFQTVDVMGKMHEVFTVNYMLCTLLYCAVVFATGCLITLICKKIPFLKHILT